MPRTNMCRTLGSWARRAAVVLAAWAALAAPGGASAVWVVDAGGGGDFSELQPAIDAADDGDILLVKPGNYVVITSPHTLDGKGLEIIGDGLPRPTLGAFEIANLSGSSRVLLRDVDLEYTISPFGPTLWLHDNVGVVQAEGITAAGRPGAWSGTSLPSRDGEPAVGVENCAGVTLVDCDLNAGDGISTNFPPWIADNPSSGGPALIADGSSLAIWGGSLAGGRGGDAIIIAPGDALHGGSGLIATDCVLFLSGVTVAGGAGGDGGTSAGNGGHGLHLSGGSNQARHLASLFSGGAAGQTGTIPGTAGLPNVVDAGSLLIDLGGSARSLRVTALARENAPVDINYQGLQGDFMGLFLSIGSTYVPLWGKSGVFSLGSPLLGPTVLADVTDPGGVFALSFPAWDLTGTGIEGLSVIMQALVRRPGGGIVLTSPTSITDVDDVF